MNKQDYKIHIIGAESIKISSEYDFQNLVHLVLRPWIPSVDKII